MEQVRRKEFNDEEIGMGFNSESGLAIGTALEGFTVTADPVAPGQEVDAEITTINSHEELMESLGMSFEAQGRYGFFSGSAKAKFASTSSYNSTSTFLVARCIVKNPFKRGKNFRVTSEARALLDSLRFDEFKTAFGDSFVRGLQTGGEFYAVIRITSVSSTKQTELAATLQAAFSGLVTAADFKAQYSEANTSISTRSEYQARMFQRAGSGLQISPTVEISEVITRYKNFPEIARTSAFAYETEIATYDTLPLPIPTQEEQENFLFALRDAREKKLYYIQKRNDLEFALRNPAFFENLPSYDVLSNAISIYTKLMNAVMDHAVKLSRGEIKPPRVFDPSTLSPAINEPAPIQLKRATPPVIPTIRVPNMTGVYAGEIDEAQICLQYGNVDQCLAGTVFTGYDGEPMPIHASPEVAKFIALERQGKVRFTYTPEGNIPEYWACDGQFPSAGTLVPNGTEIVLHFVCAAPPPNCD
ncbi:MAG: hypothetical protein N3I35_11065 [Clostridia bacterium]|nr:hypothetical protein [Clostridia bacterium]